MEINIDAISKSKDVGGASKDVMSRVIDVVIKSKNVRSRGEDAVSKSKYAVKVYRSAVNIDIDDVKKSFEKV